MESLVRFSKFKLDVHSIIAENESLKEAQHIAREELEIYVQRQKEAESALSKKLHELQTELTSRDELQGKLETKIKHLEEDNSLLENKQKEMRETLDNLLKSRDAFIEVYEDSTCSLKSSIIVKEKKLNLLSNKVQRHLSLFRSIAKETEALRVTVDNIQQLMSEKENVVIGLKERMDRFSMLEKELKEKIHIMEDQVRNYKQELRKKDGELFDLKEKIHSGKGDDIILKSQVNELEKSLSIKDETIERLTAEKKDLHLELLTLELLLQKLQSTVSVSYKESNQNVSSSPLEASVQKMSSGEENGRYLVMGRKRQASGEDHPSKIPCMALTENPAEQSCSENVDDSRSPQGSVSEKN